LAFLAVFGFNLVNGLSSNRVNKFVNALRDRKTSEPDTAASVSQISIPKPSAKPPSIPFFDPQLLSKLGRLDLIATTVVDGFLSGKHRSTHKGGCTDFAEFRPYARGDDIRLLDWRHYARSDRYYVKRYDDETNLQALLIVDTSGSMNFGLSTVSKWRYAQMAAASLAHLLLRQRDSVGLALVRAARRRIDHRQRAQRIDGPAQAARHGGAALRLLWRRDGAEAHAGAIQVAGTRCPRGADSRARGADVPVPA
jgi:hypothetical protein